MKISKLGNTRTVLVAAHACLAGLGANAQDVNLAAHQFTTATSVQGEYSPLFLADGKVGPRNRWVSTNRGRQRVNLFFQEELEIGSMHVYSFAYDMVPVSGLTGLRILLSGPLPFRTTARSTTQGMRIPTR